MKLAGSRLCVSRGREGRSPEQNKKTAVRWKDELDDRVCLSRW